MLKISPSTQQIQLILINSLRDFCVSHVKTKQTLRLLGCHGNGLGPVPAAPSTFWSPQWKEVNVSPQQLLQRVTSVSVSMATCMHPAPAVKADAVVLWLPTVCSPCPDGWRRFRSSCYLFDESKYYSNWRTWEGSRRRCKEFLADLVVIESLEEQARAVGVNTPPQHQLAGLLLDVRAYFCCVFCPEIIRVVSQMQEFLRNHTKFYNDAAHGYWIGLRIGNTDRNTWRWIDGSNVTLE